MEHKTPVLRHLLNLLVSVIPDKLVYNLGQELAEKQSRARRRLLKYYGKNLYIASSAIIYAPERVTFGDNCAINDFVHIRASGGVRFGNGVWVANSATITSETHPADVDYIGEHPPVYSSILIEDHVWIGSGSVILPGITLGRSCIVGAGSVVTKDVAPYAIVAGVPARVLRYKDFAAGLEDQQSSLVSASRDTSAPRMK